MFLYTWHACVCWTLWSGVNGRCVDHYFWAFAPAKAVEDGLVIVANVSYGAPRAPGRHESIFVKAWGTKKRRLESIGSHDGPHAALRLEVVVDEGFSLTAGLGLGDDRGHRGRPAHRLAHFFFVRCLVSRWDLARIL